MIWERAMQPRIVEIQIAGITFYSATNTILPIKQYSNAPIPILLYTCHDSRSALQACGYELAFGTPNQAPQIWFNFSIDVLFVTETLYAERCVKNFHSRFDVSTGTNVDLHVPYRKDDYVQLVDNDRLRVRRLAVCSSVSEGRKSYSDLRFRPAKMVEMFGNLTELLVVEEHIFASPNMLRKPDTYNLLGYLDCDVADSISISGIAPVVETTQSVNHYAIKSYKEETQSNGEYYFLDEIENMKEALWGMWNERNGKDYWWSIPTTIRVVRLVTEAEARHILSVRNRYWDKLDSNLWAEFECGIAPPSPISTRFTDEWAAADDAFGHDDDPPWLFWDEDRNIMGGIIYIY